MKPRLGALLSSVEFDGAAEGDERKAGEVSLREEWSRLLLEVAS
jgi:hypothetical protein